MASFKKKNKEKKRVVVITNGPDTAYVAEYDFVNKMFTFNGIFPVANLEEERIIDANGAGDAFAGGFLALFMKGNKLEDCAYAVKFVINFRDIGPLPKLSKLGDVNSQNFVITFNRKNDKT